MPIKENVDIVKFLRTLVHELKSHASSQGVTLSFQTKIGSSSFLDYDAKNIKEEITKFIKQVILYVPEQNKVTVLFDVCENDDRCCTLTISNSGINLYRIMAIPASTKFNTEVLGDSFTSCKFMVEIPLLIKETNTNEEDKSDDEKLKPYYAEIGKRLSDHYTNPSSIFVNTMTISKKERAFLLKVNAVVGARLEDNTFTVDKFAQELFLSRAQLFRKMKALTKMSPSQYLLHFRLQAAKKLLESKDLDLNVSDACYSTGFMSKSHFTRSFRKQFGMLPSQIRQN